MPGTYLSFPFDEELFLNSWAAQQDTTLNAILESGAMVNDATIANMISQGSNLYTMPFYKDITGTPVNLDGATDITTTTTEGSSQSGIVYGRAKAFTAKDFVGTLSGNDPMGFIVSRVAKYWNNYRQNRILGILGAVFGISGNTGWTSHTVDLCSSSAVASKITATTLNDLATDTLGDNKSAYKLAIMHSEVARTLENLEVLDHWKYTDANGIQRPTSLASVNGYTVIIDDACPKTAVGGSGANQNLYKYTTYLLGEGVLRYAQGRLTSPAAEVDRSPATNGGQDTLYTRIRETIHPNGFTFTPPANGFTESPTDAQLDSTSNWSIIHNAKAIPMARVYTNG